MNYNGQIGGHKKQMSGAGQMGSSLGQPMGSAGLMGGGSAQPMSNQMSQAIQNQIQQTDKQNAHLQGGSQSTILGLEILKKQFLTKLADYTQLNQEYSSYLSQYPPDNYVTNGNFAQPAISSNNYQYITSSTQVPGWVFNGAVLMNKSSAWGFPMPYPNGDQAVSIQNTASLSQTLTTNPGTYNLSFMACARNCCDGSKKGNPVNVQINGNTILALTPPVNKWKSYSTTFTVDASGSTVLAFIGTNSSGDKSTAIQNIVATNNKLSSISRAVFLGTNSLKQVQKKSVHECIAYCTSDPNCTGATYNKKQQHCNLNSGRGSILPSTDSDNYAIASQNLKYLYLIKNANNELLKIGSQIQEAIDNGQDYYDDTLDEFDVNHQQLKDIHSLLSEQRKGITQVIKEIENYNSDLKESSLFTSTNYSIYLFLLILSIIMIILFVIFFVKFTNGSSSSSTSQMGGSGFWMKFLS